MDFARRPRGSKVSDLLRRDLSSRIGISPMSAERLDHKHAKFRAAVTRVLEISPVEYRDTLRMGDVPAWI